MITSTAIPIMTPAMRGGSHNNMISVRLNDPRGTGYTQLWLSRGTGAYTYDWTRETRYGSMRASVGNVFTATSS
ncbi:hypothetical protein ACLK1S_02240 [Escherichia coli]